MAIFGDDDKPVIEAAHKIGQDLSQLSLEEIDRRVALLKAEIERLDAARKAKQASRAAADLFFKGVGSGQA
ncbi:MAG: DUF1192 domain-containing protein [Hyphomicrobiales bacterium]|jgi:uncharacterized small protein (DUF1192 family)|nr:DUF1192 domain-containing protein [Hyphomicrobiales bacterium]